MVICQPVKPRTVNLSECKKKIDAGSDFFQAQVVYDAEQKISFLSSSKQIDKPVLVGILHLKRARMAHFVNDSVDGIDVPDDIIACLENKEKSGIEITCAFIKEIYEYTDGIHIMAMDDIKGTNEIIEYVKSL